MSQEIEISQIERRYAALRIHERARLSQLAASLMDSGQHTPVLVVGAGEDRARYILIDGYARVAALDRIGSDVVRALVLEIAESDALIFAHRLDSHRSRCVLEEAWLIRELVETHGQTLGSLACQLWRTKSWVSRRLALVRLVPETVQEAVRAGRIPAHAAMKYLAPLARANRPACERLVERLGEKSVSVRQLERLYTAWRTGNAEQRQRIVEEPWLFLKAAEELEQHSPLPERFPAREPALCLLKDLGAIGALCRRARAHINAGALAGEDVVVGDAHRAFAEARTAFGSLTAHMDKEEALRARAGHAHGHLALAR